MLTEVPLIIQKLSDLGIRPVLPIDTVIYKYASLETAKKIITSSSLMFSPPSVFNDPFDLSNSLVDKSFTEEIITKWVDKFEHLSNQQKQELLKKTTANPQSVLDTLDTTLDRFKNLTGISCFSRCSSQVLMWSHYAEKHSGICLGFNIIPIGIEEFSLLEVNYASQISPLNFFIDKPYVLFNWLFTKSKVWSYEEEVRAVFWNQNGIIPFYKSCLKEIHFGLRTTQKQREEVIELLKTYNYELQKIVFMTMSQNSFDLQENPIV